MAKVTFDSSNKAKSAFDFPKLYLDQGERARIVAIEAEPEMEYVHTLNAPEVIGGSVTMQNVKQKDGTVVERPKMNFVGRHICFGNPNTMQEKGKDPENCPTCAAHQQNDAIQPAKRRFAMHVVQYRTQPGSFKVQTPFQAELVVWSFTDRAFNTLVEIAEEHGDLRKKDLLLGPCENKMFQNFDIQVGGSAEWLNDEERKKFVMSLYANNKLDDLQPAIARKVTKDMAQDDIQKVLLKHAQAFGGNTGDAVVGGASSEAASTMDLDNLLGGGGTSTPSTEAAPEEPAASTPDVPSLDTPSEPTPTTETSEEPKEEKQEPKKETMDFDSLLEGLEGL